MGYRVGEAGSSADAAGQRDEELRRVRVGKKEILRRPPRRPPQDDGQKRFVR
jgi:hypothetical protein